MVRTAATTSGDFGQTPRGVPGVLPGLPGRARRAAALLTVLLIAHLGLGQTNPATLPAVPDPPSVLRDPAADRAARAAAADTLLASGPVGEPALREALESPSSDGLDRLLVLDALSRSLRPPDSLWSAVRVAIAAMQAEPIPAFQAVAAFRTRNAASVLSEYLADSWSASVRTAACAALARLTGRDEFGPDPARWSAWAREMAALSDSDWDRALARGHAARADRLTAEVQGLRQQLALVYRRYYVQIPAGERPAFLSELLIHESEDLRAVGFDLARREISSGQRLNGEVTGAALRLLEDRSPQARERAALLVDLLAPADALPEVAAALEREADPRAAAALLAAAARWPAAETWIPVVRWLATIGPSRTAAAQTGLALLREGVPPAEPQRSKALEVLRAAPLATLGPNSLRLLVALGGDGDRAGVADLLKSPESEARLAAAEALAQRPEYLDRILEAASRHPALFSTAAAATLNHRRTAAGYWAIDALAAPSEQQKSEELLKLAAVLSIPDLVSVVSRVPGEALRERMLSRLATTAATGAPAEMATGLLLLAETRLALGLPEGAIAALDALAPFAETIDPNRPLSLRTGALLFLGRVESAESLNAPAGAWMQGLRRCTSLPHAGDIIAAIRRLFAGVLTPDDLRLLDEIEARIAASSPPPADGGPLTNGGPG